MALRLVKSSPFDDDLPPLSTRERVDMVRYEDYLADFTKDGWRYANEPQDFESNWHIDMMADYLTAIAKREIKGPGPIVVSEPPRHMKSRGVNVFFPPWVWAQDPDPDNTKHGRLVRPNTLMGPGVKFAYISYAQRLSNEQSDACRLLIRSDWYQRRWGERVQLARDATEHFNNTAGGERRALSFSGITGFGADIIVVDDAHDIENVDSAVVREAVLNAWDNVLQSRRNDARTGIFIVIMQRSHERDLIGHILAKEFGGVHICLPAEFEAKHPLVFSKAPPAFEVKRQTDTSNGTDRGPKIGEPWYDFRKEGELLWPTRFPKKELDYIKTQMTSHAYAGQYQQRPTAREGGLFKRQWFMTVPFVINREKLQLVRGWDTAASVDVSSDPDYSAGVLLGLDPELKVYYVLDVIHGRYTPGQLETLIKRTAVFDGPNTRIVIPKEPGSQSQFFANYMVGKLAGYAVSTEREQGGDKTWRASPLAAQCEHGFVRLAQAPWNAAYIDEFCAFRPEGGSHDDRVDATCAAFRGLTRSGGGICLVAA